MKSAEFLEDKLGFKYALPMLVWVCMKANTIVNRILLQLEKWPAR